MRLRLMKAALVTFAAAALLAACNKSESQGGSEQPPVTGRGSGEQGDTGGNGKVYDRGGPPGSANPSRQKPGSGRIDQGGGATSGGPIDNSVPTNSSGSATGATKSGS